MTGALAGWSEMAAALAIFFASHILPARPPIRRRLRMALGGGLYIALYSAVSLSVLAWLILAAGRAPYVELWPFEPWQLWAPNIAMPIVCLLIAFGVAAPNPFSIGGRHAERFDPDRPGVAGVTRHPLLWAITLWALAHLLPNGDLAHAIMFGLFAGFGLIGMMALDKRRQREWGHDLWAQRASRTAFIPLVGALNGRLRLAELKPDLTRISAAVVLYLALLLSHDALIGASPLPAY